MPSIPYGVNVGGSLAWAGGDYIYALVGGGPPYFYRYSVSGNSWASMPSVGPSVYDGGCLEYAYRHIYALAGGGSSYFRRFGDADVAVIGVTVSDTEVFEGETVNVAVTVKNEGISTETFNTTAYYDGEAIGNQTVWNLPSGNQAELIFTWNTTGVMSGSYIISAEAEEVPDETDTADNTLQNGVVVIHCVRIYWNPTCPYPFVPSSIPREGEPVNVTAKILFNGSAPIRVVLFHRVNGCDWWNTTMTYNLWAIIIPGQPGNSTVEFFLTAYDNAENAISSETMGYTVIDLIFCDINGDGIVDITDIYLTALHFGEMPP